MQLIAVTYCCFLADSSLPLCISAQGLYVLSPVRNGMFTSRQLIADGPLSLTVKYHEVGKSKLILECML